MWNEISSLYQNESQEKSLQYFVKETFRLFFCTICLGPSTGGDSSVDGPPKVTLVYFIGGCTHAEISALRFLAQQENSKFLNFGFWLVRVSRNFFPSESDRFSFHCCWVVSLLRVVQSWPFYVLLSLCLNLLAH